MSERPERSRAGTGGADPGGDGPGLRAGAASLAVHGALAAAFVFAAEFRALPEPRPEVVFELAFVAPPVPPAPAPVEDFAAALAEAALMPEELEPAPAEAKPPTPVEEEPVPRPVPARPPALDEEVALAGLPPPRREAEPEPPAATLVLVPRPARKPPTPAPRATEPLATAAVRPPPIPVVPAGRCRVVAPPPPPPARLAEEPLPDRLVEDTLARYARLDSFMAGWRPWAEAAPGRAAGDLGRLLAKAGRGQGPAGFDAGRGFDAGPRAGEALARAHERARTGARERLGPESGAAWQRELASYEWRRWQAWAYQAWWAQERNRLLAAATPAAEAVTLECSEAAEAAPGAGARSWVR